MTATDRPVVLACDEAYAMPLATTLRSIVEADRSGRPLEFHVLTTGMPQAARNRVLGSLPPGSASIRWVPVGMAAFEGFQTRPHISGMTFARLLLPSVFAGVPRVLYLDADILVLDDLAPLWATDLCGAAVGAVPDGMDPQLKRGEPGLEGVPRVRDYFNAGVLLIDLEEWRKRRVGERALEYLNKHPKSPFSDQDALNVACDGDWARLDARWNCQAHLHHNALPSVPVERRPAIVHFVTSGKPWNAWVPNANAAVYDAFRQRTLFARTGTDRARDHALRFGRSIKEALNRRAAGRAMYRALKRLWRRGRAARRTAGGAARATVPADGAASTG